MDFGLLPPEVNSALIYTGPGSGPMLAAAAGWSALATQLETTATGCAAELAALAGQAWSGPSSLLMAAAVTPYVEWLSSTAAEAGKTAIQAVTAAAAYEAAFAMTVPPPVIAANRAQLAALIATNFFGQNTPAIAATEIEYLEMWAQDAAAMYGYAANASVATALSPFEEPTPTTNEAGLRDQARALAQAAADVVKPVTPGQTVTVAPGGAITIGTDTTMSVDSGSITVTGAGTLLVNPGPLVVNPGSTVQTIVSCLEGTTVIPANTTVSSGSGPITLTPLSGNVIVSVVNGSTTVYATGGAGVVQTSANTATALVGPTGASITNVLGTVSADVIPAPTSASALNASSLAAVTAPGLAGTSGIQPQLDVERLLEAIQTVSSAR